MEIDRLIDVLHRIAESQEQLLLELRQRMPVIGTSSSDVPEKILLTRQEVQDYLKICETTYKRRVRQGKLKPMKIAGGDHFYKHELEAALAESKRRGKI
jgi:hypothetical protein